VNGNHVDYELNILQPCESNIDKYFMGRKSIKVNSQYCLLPHSRSERFAYVQVHTYRWYQFNWRQLSCFCVVLAGHMNVMQAGTTVTHAEYLYKYLNKKISARVRSTEGNVVPDAASSDSVGNVTAAPNYM
jgi:hypothetical protein